MFAIDGELSYKMGLKEDRAGAKKGIPGLECVILAPVNDCLQKEVATIPGGSK